MTWQKGESGNPGGRPAMLKEVRQICQDISPEGCQVLHQIMWDEKQPASARVAAVREIFDRAMGKPEQEHRVSGQINFAHLLAEYSQLMALEEGGKVQVLDLVDGHAVDDDAKANGNGAA